MDGRRDVAAFIDIYICTSHPMALALSFSEALSSLRELAILVRCGWCEWIQGRERDTDCRAEVGPSTPRYPTEMAQEESLPPSKGKGKEIPVSIFTGLWVRAGGRATGCYMHVSDVSIHPYIPLPEKPRSRQDYRESLRVKRSRTLVADQNGWLTPSPPPSPAHRRSSSPC